MDDADAGRLVFRDPVCGRARVWISVPPGANRGPSSQVAHTDLAASARPRDRAGRRVGGGPCGLPPGSATTSGRCGCARPRDGTGGPRGGGGMAAHGWRSSCGSSEVPDATTRMRWPGGWVGRPAIAVSRRRPMGGVARWSRRGTTSATTKASGGQTASSSNPSRGVGSAGVHWPSRVGCTSASPKIRQHWSSTSFSMPQVPPYADSAPRFTRRYIDLLAGAAVWFDNGWLPFDPDGPAPCPVVARGAADPDLQPRNKPVCWTHLATFGGVLHALYAGRVRRRRGAHRVGAHRRPIRWCDRRRAAAAPVARQSGGSTIGPW